MVRGVLDSLVSALGIHVSRTVACVRFCSPGSSLKPAAGRNYHSGCATVDACITGRAGVAFRPVQRLMGVAQLVWPPASSTAVLAKGGFRMLRFLLSFSPKTAALCRTMPTTPGWCLRGDGFWLRRCRKF